MNNFFTIRIDSAADCRATCPGSLHQLAFENGGGLKLLTFVTNNTVQLICFIQLFQSKTSTKQSLIQIVTPEKLLHKLKTF